jgi:hypothetical protein
METPERRRASVACSEKVRRLSASLGLCSTFAFWILASGCASPGDPATRRPPQPQAVTDLAAAKEGNDVILTFTLPKETADQRPLDRPQTVTIYRDFASAAEATNKPLPVPANPPPLVTIPAGMVPNYSAQGHVRYTDSFRSADFTNHIGMVAVYTVRTSVSKKAASPDSNAASVSVEPAADPIADLSAKVTPSGVALEWSAPARTLLPPAATIVGYRIYRGEPAVGTVGANAMGQSARGSAGTPETPKLALPLAKIGDSPAPPFLDTQAEFNETYVYSVRSIVQDVGESVESGDSNLVMLTPKDVFPPAAPQGLVVTAVPAQGEIAAHLELSWAISPETDVAGYNIDRADQPSAPAVRLNTQLLLTPAFRDMNVQPGRAYYYSVTAVDRAGNESAPSATVSGTVAAENQKTP